MMTKMDAMKKLIEHARPMDLMAGELALICTEGLFKKYGGIYDSFELAIAFCCPLMNRAVTSDTMYSTAQDMIEFATLAADRTLRIERERNA